MSHLVLLLIGSASHVTISPDTCNTFLFWLFAHHKLKSFDFISSSPCSISTLCLHFDGCLVEFLWLAPSTGWLTCLSNVCYAAARTQNVLQEAASPALTFEWISFEDKWAVIAATGNVEQWLEVCQDIVQFFFFFLSKVWTSHLGVGSVRTTCYLWTHFRLKSCLPSGWSLTSPPTGQLIRKSKYLCILVVVSSLLFLMLFCFFGRKFPNSVCI